ncbi:MAG: winged helix DNA-binding protein, partial [Candidatus Omnitrophica bacterium]|nr:winged helix DNA-binding protein [Candidatus Omnitrophota bacterium]
TTAVIDRMIEQEYVERERDSRDRRVVLVKASPKGKKMQRELMRLRTRTTNDMFSVLTEKEKKEYLRLIRKVHDNLIAGEKDGR